MEVVPFKLDQLSQEQPSEFEVQFIQKGIKYIYGLMLDSEKIIEEYLFSYPKGRKKQIFERDEVDQFEFKSNKEEQKLLASRTLPNRLYLSTATEWNFEETKNAFEWFQQKLQIWGNDEFQHMNKIVELIEEDKELKKIIVNFLNDSDIGITDIEVQNKEVDEDSIPPALLKFISRQMSEEPIPNLKKAQSKISIFNVGVEFIHTGYDVENQEVDVKFKMSEESLGTRKLFHILGYWIPAILEDQVIFCDEIETSLHPHIMRKLIEIFQVNLRSKAQLIFTTHSPYLLDADIFRRDQIWFTEKDPKFGKTDLYSLCDISVRKDENYQKGYLLGKYGGIPITGEGLSTFYGEKIEGSND